MAARGRRQNGADDNNENAPNPKAEAYLRDLLQEKLSVDTDKCPNVIRILDAEIAEAQANQKAKPRENRFLDVLNDRPTKVITKVLVPVKEFPKYNFMGKLLGPKGEFLKALQQETMCRISILGRGSMKDKAKEEELRNSGEPTHAHLLDPLHVEINALGPPAEAYARISYALAEIKKCLTPDNMEMMEPPRRRMPVPPPQAPFRAGGPGGRVGGPPGGRGGNLMQRAAQSKTNVMSILSRARMAMEDSYDDGAEEYEEYDDYSAAAPMGRSMMGPAGGMRRGGGGGGGGYDEYEEDYYQPKPKALGGGGFGGGAPDQGRGGWGPSKSRQSGGGAAARPATGGRFRSAPYSKPGK